MSDTERQSQDAASTGTGYRVLARKYRPKDFTDLMVGQEPMVRTLTNAFETGRIAQAYMLTGVRGVGKTTTARILARALNYKTPEIDKPTIDLRVPGEHCQAIMEGRHVDVIEMDAASHTGIDDIREIIEQVRYRPVSARYKVYIIDEVHMLSTQAFNGLLKTLEEPPAAREVHFCDHRNPQGSDYRSLALPALRSPPHQRGGSRRLVYNHRSEGRHRCGAGCAGDDRARRRRLGT